MARSQNTSRIVKTFECCNEDRRWVVVESFLYPMNKHVSVHVMRLYFGRIIDYYVKMSFMGSKYHWGIIV
jgi:hypothetical protein